MEGVSAALPFVFPFPFLPPRLAFLLWHSRSGESVCPLYRPPLYSACEWFPPYCDGNKYRSAQAGRLWSAVLHFLVFELVIFFLALFFTSLFPTLPAFHAVCFSIAISFCIWVVSPRKGCFSYRSFFSLDLRSPRLAPDCSEGWTWLLLHFGSVAAGSWFFLQLLVSI